MKLKNSLLVAAALLATPVVADSPRPEAPQPREGTIVETAASVKDFSTLVAAVKAAGLVDALNSRAPSPSSRPPTRCPSGSPRAWPSSCCSPRTRTPWSRSSPSTWCPDGSPPPRW